MLRRRGGPAAPSVGPTARSAAIATLLASPPRPVGGDPVAATVAGDLLARATDVAAFCAANAAAIDDEERFPAEEFGRVAAAGLLTVPLAAELGGLGLGSQPGGFGPLLELLQRLGWGSLPVGRLYEGHANALALIQTYGTPRQIARFAADARDRDLLFAVWNTEGADGVRLLPIGDGRFRLEGSKIFASGAGHVQRPLLTGALPDGGWQMLVLRSEEVATRIDRSWWRPLGMRASASYKIDLSGVEIGADDVLGAPGDYYRQPWFGAGAIRFAAVQLGGGAALLDAARDDLRRQGRIDDPHQQTRFGEAAVAVEGGRLWLRAAAALADRSPLGGAAAGGVANETMLAYANLTRTAVERACLDVLERVERGIGSRGLLRPHPVERIGRDLTLYLRQPAPDAALASAGHHVLAAEPSSLDLWRPPGDGDATERRAGPGTVEG